MDEADVVVCAEVASLAPLLVPWKEPEGAPLGVVPGMLNVAFPSPPMLPAIDLTAIVLVGDTNLGAVFHFVVRLPLSALLPARAVQPFSPAVRVLERTPDTEAPDTVTPSLVVQPVSLALIDVVLVPADSEEVMAGV